MRLDFWAEGGAEIIKNRGWDGMMGWDGHSFDEWRGGGGVHAAFFCSSASMCFLALEGCFEKNLK